MMDPKASLPNLCPCVHVTHMAKGTKAEVGLMSQLTQ